RADMTVLDIGGGRHPALPRAERPERTRYIGLDPDRGELDAAGPDAYDRVVFAGAETEVPDLAGTIDLALSWQVFEHVRSLDVVLDNLHSYLTPSGTLVRDR